MADDFSLPIRRSSAERPRDENPRCNEGAVYWASTMRSYRCSRIGRIVGDGTAYTRPGRHRCTDPSSTAWCCLGTCLRTRWLLGRPFHPRGKELGVRSDHVQLESLPPTVLCLLQILYFPVPIFLVFHVLPGQFLLLLFSPALPRVLFRLSERPHIPSCTRPAIPRRPLPDRCMRQSD